MSPAARFALAVLVVVAGVAGLGLGPRGEVAGASPPAITVTVDGTAVADGNTTQTESDPTVGVNVTADQPIRVVSVRVDGTTRRRYTPNATALDRSFTLQLDSGDHTLDVVVKAGSVTTHSVTVTKDAERPYVRYTSPFETDRYAPPPERVTVNATSVVLGGEFTDVTGVTHLRILRETEYEVGSVARTDRAVYTADDLNGTFRQPLFLGVGRNNVTARYYDRVGHTRKHQFRIVVEDSAPPTLSNLSAVRLSPSTLRIRGDAVDNGQIRSISVSPKADSGTAYLVDPGLGEPNPARQRMTFGTNVTLYPGATAVVLNATDTAGNSIERTVTVRRNVVPELVLARGGTRFANRSTVVARGRATDGEIVAASVETVDPSTGEVIDIASLHDGGIVTDLTFERRLDAPEGRHVTVRLRVIDSSGTEHVATLDRTWTAETPTATATATPVTPTATATPVTPTATPATPTPAPTDAGFTLPLLGVTVPVPAVLGASVTLPVPVVGPFDLPIAPVVALLVLGLGLGVVGRVR
ncbi:MAG: hypothetical protein ABEJ73_11035 [Haloplanus sp.]